MQSGLVLQELLQPHGAIEQPRNRLWIRKGDVDAAAPRNLGLCYCRLRL